MIKIVTTEEITLTTLATNGFGDVIETQLPLGTEVTIWLDDPDAIGKDYNLTWRIPLFMWIGNYTERDVKPSIKLKEVSSKYDVKLFEDELYTPKYPFTQSDKPYVFSMIDNQNRLLVSFLYANSIFPEGSLEIVGI
jgi:hypothetical protein